MTALRPMRTVNDRGGYDEEHPAYAVMGASRVSSTPGGVLFGSDFRHQHYVVVRIGAASLRRDLANDWVDSVHEQYIEVAMSEAQWATFVSAMNVGGGVPVTLQWKQGEGRIPDIIPTTDRREQLHEEIDARLVSAIDSLKEVRDAAPTKAQRSKIDTAIRQLEANLPWVAQQFDEHAEKTVERMKVEVNAYMTAAIQRAGIKALGGDEPLLELAEPEEAQS